MMCRCCLTTDPNVMMISLNSQSSHDDQKSLEDYLNTLLQYPNSSSNEATYPEEICLRCCKALQVSYHFLLMTFKSKSKLEELMKIKKVVFEGVDSSAANMARPIVNAKTVAVNVNITQADDETFTVTMEGCEMEEKTQNKGKETSRPESVSETNISSKYKCRYCGETTDKHQDLIHHTLKEHKYLIPFKCKKCNYSTCNPESLLNHYKKHHKLEDVEQRLYQTKELLESSAKEEAKHESTTFTCKMCEYQTHTMEEMDEHLLQKHDDDIPDDRDSYIKVSHNCPLCYRQFANSTAAKIHYTMTHNTHKRRNDPALHICKTCGKSFDLKTSLLSHERRCAMREPVICNFCQVQFSSVAKYEEHIQMEHSVAIKYECEVCEKSFKTSAYLMAHRKRHNERHYQCDLCPKNYINHAELKVHVQRIHRSSVKKKEHEGNLEENSKRRMSVNSMKTVVHCGFCDFTSTSKFAMEVHMYKHTGRPYKCKLCPKQFVLKTAIKQHCRRYHSISITDSELAAMFKEKHGYPSRFDAFSDRNNLYIDEVDITDLQVELNAFNLTLEDIMQEVFDDSKIED